MKKTILLTTLCLMAGLLFTGCKGSGADEELKLDQIKKRIESVAETKTAADETKNTEESATPGQAADETQADLRELLIRETRAAENEIASFLQDDFDGDGTEEAFALVGQVIDDWDSMKTVEGTVWFVSKDGCTDLYAASGMGLSDRTRMMQMGDTKYVLFDEVYATGLLTYVWSVSDGQAKQAPFSALGEVLTDTPDGAGRFRIMDSSYDCMYNPESSSWMGHTWKHYYFFYNDDDGPGRVEEYAGTPIDADTVQYLCGRDLIGDLIAPGDQVDSVFCRGNGLIVINYEHFADGCAMYYHYIYDFSKGCFVDDTGVTTGEEPLDGICKEALCPSIASYPQVPTPDGGYLDAEAEPYCGVLYRYKELQDSGKTWEEMEQVTPRTSLMDYGWPYSTNNDEIRYVYADLNGDGYDELIITYCNDPVDVYTNEGDAVYAYGVPYRGISRFYPDGTIWEALTMGVKGWRETWYRYNDRTYKFESVGGKLDPKMPEITFPEGKKISDVVIPEALR
ncbi:MAG: hypothetical protein J6Y57_07260, partial [Lachnospiraceae bacterium]|nr:hypothetical protein [Lachnospiraceae bacterium]